VFTENRFRSVRKRLLTLGMTTDGGLKMLILSALGFLLFSISAVPLRDLAPNTQNRMVYDDLSQKGVSEKAGSQDISFEPGGAVHGITDDDCEFSKTGWGSSDGFTVFLTIYFCKSPIHAQTVLNELTKDAKVFEKRTLTTGRKKTGERIVASFTKNLIKRPEMILWTKENEIYMVESTSFEHALIFETKWLKY